MSQAQGGRSLFDIRNEIYASAEAQQYRRAQQQAAFQTQLSQQIASLQSGFQTQMQEQQAAQQQALQAQQAQFAQAAQQQEQRMVQMQQEAARRAAPQQTPQVLGLGKSLTIRPGAGKKFSRPELQIKSVNI